MQGQGIPLHAPFYIKREKELSFIGLNLDVESNVE